MSTPSTITSVADSFGRLSLEFLFLFTMVALLAFAAFAVYAIWSMAKDRD